MYHMPVTSHHISVTLSPNAPEKTTGNQKQSWFKRDSKRYRPTYLWSLRPFGGALIMNWKPHWCQIKFSHDKCFSPSISLLFSPAASCFTDGPLKTFCTLCIMIKDHGDDPVTHMMQEMSDIPLSMICRIPATWREWLFGYCAVFISWVISVWIGCSRSIASLWGHQKLKAAGSCHNA